MKNRVLVLALAVWACEGNSPAELVEETVQNQVRVAGRISSNTTLVALPVKLAIPTQGDPTGMNTVLDSTTSSAADGRYELSATVDPALCAGWFTIALYDAFGRFVGKNVNGCGPHSENFEVGPGIPND